MCRRTAFYQTPVRSALALIIVCFLTVVVDATEPAGLFFPANVPTLEWDEFAAAGFSQPVSGIVFDGEHPACCGVALGGLGTGSLDIETTGVLGFNCIFNPPEWPRGRGPQLQLPFLGLSIGNDVWVLATQKFIDGGVIDGCTDPMNPFKLGEVSPELRAHWQAEVPRIEGVHAAEDIHYWGHYPVADLEYEINAPVRVGLRAWSPFVPGDMIASRIPGAVFEIRLRNDSDAPQKVTLAFSFPGPNRQPKPYPKLTEDEGIKIFQQRKPLVDDYGKFRSTNISEKGLKGVEVSSLSEKKVSYFLGVLGDEDVRTGKGLSQNPVAWSKIASALPQPARDDGNLSAWSKTPEELAGLAETSQTAPSTDSSVSVAVDCELMPHETKTLRYVLAWYSPHWKGLSYLNVNCDSFDDHQCDRWSPDPEASDTKREYYTAIYALDFDGAVGVAQQLARDHESLLERILAWQQVVYTDEKLPVWLRDCLVNNLYLIPENSYWAQPKAPVQWSTPLGAFGLDECPRGCSAMGCIVSNWYGDLPLAYFFPELERMILRNYMEYMRPDGAIALLFAAGDFTIPGYEWLSPLNGSCFADLVHRLWIRTKDDSVLQEFYPVVKKNLIFTMNMKAPPEGIISAPRIGRGQEWWEHTPVQGMVSHLGGMRLAHLRIGERMAEQMGDDQFARQCHTWYEQGSALLEEHLWTGEYYMFFNNLENSETSDLIMSSQLDGDWSIYLNGLGKGAFRAERARTALDSIYKTCLVDCGLVGFSDPETSAMLLEYGTFPPEINIVGMTYLYHGKRDIGLEIIRRNMDNTVRKQRHAWDSPNLVRCDDGRRTYGSDYFQNMVLWAVPAALENQDLTGPCEPGGLAYRVLEAAKKREP